MTDLQSAERLAQLCKALAHPVRIQIMDLLRHQTSGCYCGDLADKFGVAQSTMSHHLKALREAGWIRGTEAGPATCYCADLDTLAEFRRLLDWV